MLIGTVSPFSFRAPAIVYIPWHQFQFLNHQIQAIKLYLQLQYSWAQCPPFHFVLQVQLQLRLLPKLCLGLFLGLLFHPWFLDQNSVEHGQKSLQGSADF